ncbi:MAG: hypothetical protein R3324_21350, partial [Halobacteriales archaeon]|nr:hypothetical protein [Halobacteriales archaeon]
DEVPRSRVARAEIWKRTSYPGVEYRASGVFTRSGGHVRHLNALPSRLLHLMGVQFFLSPYANIVRRPSRDHLSLATAYLKRAVSYGEGVPQRVIDECLVTDFSERETDEEPPGPNTEQLRQLGYLE